MGLNKCVRILLVEGVLHTCLRTLLEQSWHSLGSCKVDCSQNVELPPLAILPQMETLGFHWQLTIAQISNFLKN